MSCQHCGREHPQGITQCPVTGEAASSPGLLGRQLDRYRVERLVGSGGFGSVYRARHVHTDAVVALKVLKRTLGADQGMVERFLREARAAAQVGDSHIVGVLDAGISPEGQVFLALEFLEGMDLKELAEREGPLSPTRLVLLAVQVLDALGAAHAKGIVHRDMKPANVFVVRRRDERGTERDFVKLLDFGISKVKAEGEERGLTMTGVAMGTPAYMAPEQFFDARNVDGRADIYSVAVMLYELLSHRLPFDADSYAALIVRVRTEQAPALTSLAPSVPAPLAQVVMAGLAKEPAQRWQTAQAFAAALRTAMGMPAPGSTPAFVAVTPVALPAPADDVSAPPSPSPAAPQWAQDTARPLAQYQPGVSGPPHRAPQRATGAGTPAGLGGAPAGMGGSPAGAGGAAHGPAAEPGMTSVGAGWTPRGQPGEASRMGATPAQLAVQAPGGGMPTHGMEGTPHGVGMTPHDMGVRPHGAGTTPHGMAPGATGPSAASAVPTPRVAGGMPPALKWALIITAALMAGGGCCMCGAILSQDSSASISTDPGIITRQPVRTGPGGTVKLSPRVEPARPLKRDPPPPP